MGPLPIAVTRLEARLERWYAVLSPVTPAPMMTTSGMMPQRELSVSTRMAVSPA